MAPAPIDKKITAENGEYMNPPSQAPKIAGLPAINPKLLVKYLLSSGYFLILFYENLGITIGKIEMS